jgi:hypothetical protein
MLGTGGTRKLTPIYSGRVVLRYDGSSVNGTANNTETHSLYNGIGAAPANNAGVTGTQLGVAIGNTSASTFFTPRSQGGIIAGLTVGTAYWFDLGDQISAGNAQYSAMQCRAKEVL